MRQLQNAAALVGLCGALGLATSALAEQTVSEITVLGKAKAPAAETLSYKVGYADLDLRYKAGRDKLNKRIMLTARYLCRKLGETDKASYNECRDRTVKDAMPAARAAAQAAIASNTFKRGPTWTAPH